mgnify:CR=1 FL=1
MGTKNNPGDFDCYQNAEPDEPMFILLARDPDAPALVRTWCTARMARLQHDESADLEHELNKLKEAQKCARQMEEWHKENRS